MGAQSTWADIMQSAWLNRCEIWLAAVVTDFHRQFLWRNEHGEIDALCRISPVAVRHDIGTGLMHRQGDLHPLSTAKTQSSQKAPKKPLQHTEIAWMTGYRQGKTISSGIHITRALCI